MPNRNTSLSASPDWGAFLRELDEELTESVGLHCLGGFVLDVLHSIPRRTGDMDFVEIKPSAQIEKLITLAGKGSQLADKYKLHIQCVAGICTLPDDYEIRLTEVMQAEFRYLLLFALESHDLVLSKLERNSPKDREDVRYLAERGHIDPGVLRDRYRKELSAILGQRDSLRCHPQLLD